MNRLEAYVAQVARRLGPLSPAERDEESRELSQHLADLTARYAAEGVADPDGAALAQFGTAASFAAATRRAWWRGQRGAILRSLVYTAGLSMTATAFLMGVMSRVALAASSAGRLVDPGFGLRWFGVLLCLAVAAQFGVGMYVGLRRRGAAADRGALLGFLLARGLFWYSSLGWMLWTGNLEARLAAMRPDFAEGMTILPWAVALDLFLVPLIGSAGVDIGRRRAARSTTPAGDDLWARLIAPATVLAGMLGVVSSTAVQAYQRIEGTSLGPFLTVWTFLTGIATVAAYALAGWRAGHREADRPARAVAVRAVAAVAICHAVPEAVSRSVSLLLGNTPPPPGTGTVATWFYFASLSSALLVQPAAAGLAAALAVRRGRIRTA